MCEESHQKRCVFGDISKHAAFQLHALCDAAHAHDGAAHIFQCRCPFCLVFCLSVCEDEPEGGKKKREKKGSIKKTKTKHKQKTPELKKTIEKCLKMLKTLFFLFKNEKQRKCFD